MEGRTIIYEEAKGEQTDQTAYFDDKIGLYTIKRLGNAKCLEMSQVYDHLGRKCYSNIFNFNNEGTKWHLPTDIDQQTVELSAYRMYPATWLDTEILGYPCQAYFIREKAIFSPTIIFWVCDSEELPKKHVYNLQFPSLPGFVMAYSWNSKHKLVASRIEDSVDPFLFTEEGAKVLSPEERREQQKAMIFFDYIWNSSVVKSMTNLYHLFAG